MRHLKNIIRITYYFLIQLLAMLVSLIVVGLALLLKRTEEFDCNNPDSRIRPCIRFKDKWIDAIWGNQDDGIAGDIGYLSKHVNWKRNFFTMFNWCVLRNPVHNLGLRIGFNNIAIRHIGFRIGFKNSKCSTKHYRNDYKNCLDSKISKTGFEYTEVYDENNKMYPMYRLRYKYPFSKKGLKCNIGWKNWNVNKIDKSYKYTFTVLINPFKTFTT